MAVEQQLIDYIKKARQAGQADDRSKALLMQNGWTAAEISEALMSLGGGSSEAKPQQPAQQPKPQPQSQPQAQAKPQPRTQFQPEHQVSGQPEVRMQPETQPTAQYQPKPAQMPYQQPASIMAKQTRSPRGGGLGRLLSTLFIVILLLIIIGAGIYFVLTNQSFFSDLFNGALPSSNNVVQPSQQPLNNVTQNQNSSVETLQTQNTTDVPLEYDATRMTTAAFSAGGSLAVYCAPLKTTGVVSCFRNGTKLFDNPFVYRPYWIGISPDNKRVIFLYYDSVRKQSFTYEDGVEGTRFNGTITYPVFSSDSQNFAFMVMGNDGKNFVVINNTPGDPYDKVFTPPEFSFGGLYVLYGARNGQNILWVADEINKTIQATEQPLDLQPTDTMTNEGQ